MSDPNTLFLGEEHTWSFLLECVVRSVLMFLLALVLMKLSGKKEVRQFSILELIVIIGLGSALGDAMIYRDSPLLPSGVAMAVVLFLHWGLNKLTNRAPRMEALIEGEVTRVLYDGVVDLKALDNEGLSTSEFFGDLRVKHVEHLGQVKAAYVEIDGEISIYFRAKDELQPGLPLAPEAIAASTPLAQVRSYPCCCARCGHMLLHTVSKDSCARCGHRLWVAAVDFPRIS